jgi:hypothetical protein
MTLVQKAGAFPLHQSKARKQEGVTWCVWAASTLGWLLPAAHTTAARWGQPNNRGVATRVSSPCPVAADTPNPPYIRCFWLASVFCAHSWP